MLLIAFMSVGTYALDRVVCEIKVESDESATVHLKWQSGANKEGIRITSWTLIDPHTLRINYQTGTTVEAGWDTRRIEGTKYQFPMKIILEKEGDKSTTLSDLPKDENQRNSILNLYHRDIITGYVDGSFKPNNPVTRAEIAKMVTKTAEYTLSTKGTSLFKDVISTDWAHPFITTLAEKDILKGKSNGLFDPKGNVTLGEILAIINRTFTLYQQDGRPVYPHTLKQHWSNNDFTDMVELGIVQPGDSFYAPYTPDTKATRAQCAILLSRVLEQFYETK